MKNLNLLLVFPLWYLTSATGLAADFDGSKPLICTARWPIALNSMGAS